MDKNSPGDPHTIVLQAELRSAPIERVRTWLEERAIQTKRRALRVDEDAIERSLLERGAPFLDLSLARYAARPKPSESSLPSRGYKRSRFGWRC